VVDLAKLKEKAGIAAEKSEEKKRACATFKKLRPWLNDGGAETNQRQTDDTSGGLEPAMAKIESAEQETNQGQTEDTQKTTPKTPRTTKDNSGDTPGTERGHSEDTPTTDQGQIRGQDQGQDQGQARPSNQRQSADSSRPSQRIPLSLSMLVKTRRSAVLYLVQRARQARGLATNVIRADEASTALGISVVNWKKTTQRLARQGWFTLQGLDGAGGTIYTFTVDGWMTIEAATKDSYKDNFGDTPETGPRTEAETSPRTNVPLSSSSEEKNTKTTTTGTEDSAWDGIDLTPLTELGMKIGQANVRSVARVGSVTPEEFQDSVYMFAFDLRVNGKRQQIHGDVVNFFMGVLRRGPYIPPQNYKSPQIERREAYLMWKRQEAERLRAIDDEIADLDFDSWWESLDGGTRDAYAPDLVGAFGQPVGSAYHMSCVRQAYREKRRLQEQTTHD
jgi:hypothetical protein